MKITKKILIVKVPNKIHAFLRPTIVGTWRGKIYDENYVYGENLLNYKSV